MKAFENRLGASPPLWSVVRAVAVTAGAKEKHLYTRRVAGLLHRDHVGVADAFKIDVLVRLGRRSAPDPVARAPLPRNREPLAVSMRNASWR